MEAIPGGIALSKYIKPKSLIKDFLTKISHGDNMVTNRQNFAKLLRDTYNRMRGNTNELYNPILNRVGDNSIYWNRIKSPELYKSMFDPEIQTAADKMTLGAYPAKIRRLHDAFIENPTFRNAHKLQSDLGVEYNAIRKNPLSTFADRDKGDIFKDAQEKLRIDMKSMLDHYDRTLGLTDQYEDATDTFYKEVGPYLHNKKIAEIAEGFEKSPDNIVPLFKNPFKTEGAEAEISQAITPSDSWKIVKDMGPEANDRILYEELGDKPYENPKTFMKAVEKLDKRGLSPYVTPDVQQTFNSIKNRILTKEAVERGTGLAIGAGAALGAGDRGRSLPAELTGLAAAGGIGAAISPAILKAFRSAVPAERIAPAAKQIYPWLSKAAIAALLGGQ
jgi:hypothetical protein